MWTPGICMTHLVIPVSPASLPSAPTIGSERLPVVARSGSGPMCEPRAYDPPAMAVSASVVFADGVLDGRVALVTGGGTGLGRAAARELSACGASVVIAGRREEVLVAAARDIGERAGPV